MSSRDKLPPNVDELPSGSYRYRKQIDGQKINLIFDHRPSNNEITLAVSQELATRGEKVPKNTFEYCCMGYIKLKKPVLSPSTIRGYNTIIRAMSKEFKRTDINKINKEIVQQEVSDYSENHSPKSTYNFHGFISAVLDIYRPSLKLKTTLPQKEKYEHYLPSEEEIKAILEASEGTVYHIPIQLGVLGLRRSEVCALEDSDLNGNQLSISKAKVKAEEGWVIKHITKTTAGKRTIYIPDNLVKEINEKGLYKGAPDTLLHYLRNIQNKLDMPHFRFHDLRGFYASYAHSHGVPDAVILASGGWKSEYVMKEIYRQAFEKDKTKHETKIANKLLS